MLKLKGFEAVEKKYAERVKGFSSALLLGESGTGKTQMLETLPGTTLIHSFDPGGLDTLEKCINTTDKIMPDVRWESSNGDKPLATEWEREFARLLRDKVFNEVDNYVIDSYTFFSQMYIDYISKKYNRETMQIQDWGKLGGIIKDKLKECCSLPCRFILTGHIVPLKETVADQERTVGYSILANPKLQLHIPSLFSEIYCLTTKTQGQAVVRELLTDRYRNYVAKTRVGRGVFKMFETPDFTYLLNKLNKT